MGLALEQGNIDNRATQIEQNGRGYQKSVSITVERSGRNLKKVIQELPSFATKHGRCHLCAEPTITTTKSDVLYVVDLFVIFTANKKKRKLFEKMNKEWM